MTRGGQPSRVLGARVEILLPLPPRDVWKILADFDGYAAWIPTLTVQGVPKLGAEVAYRMRLRSGRTVAIPAVVETFDPSRCLEFKADFGGVFSLRQRFELTAKDRGTIVTQSLSVHGFVTRFFPRARTHANLVRLAEWVGRKLQAHCSHRQPPRHSGQRR